MTTPAALPVTGKQPKYVLDVLTTPLLENETEQVWAPDDINSATNRHSYTRPPLDFCARTSSDRRTPTARRNWNFRVNTSSSLLSSATSRSTTPHPHVSNNIVALVEGRGMAKGEIGIASINLRNPVLLLLQFADSQSYVKLLTQLNILSPVEVIMPSTVCEGGMKSKLFQLVTDMFPDTSMVTVQRKYFNENKGLEYIRRLCVPEYNTVEMEVHTKYYCLATAAALIKYVEFIQNVIFAPSSLKVVFKGSANTTMIDSSTASHLELVINMFDHRSEKTLYGVLQYTHTPGGSRMLRANILQPPSDLNTINTRLDCISELTDNEDFFYSLKSVIVQFVNAEQLLSLCVQIPKEETVRGAEQKIANVICLKHTLDLVSPLRTVLHQSKNPLFQTYFQAMSDPRFDEVLEKINLVIHSDTRYQRGALSMRMQKCFAVKPNINGLLDIARRTYTEIVDDIAGFSHVDVIFDEPDCPTIKPFFSGLHDALSGIHNPCITTIIHSSLHLTKQVAEKYNLPLRIGYTTVRGFFLQMSCDRHSTRSPPILPPIFLKVTRSRNVISFTTEDLIKLNDRIKESVNEIIVMSNIVVNQLLDVIREKIGCLYKLTEAVSTIDFLLALTHASTLSDHVRPSFGDILAIKDGRHPILDKIGRQTFVPNNTFLSDENPFVVITGPNMSGKSTYLKQVALLQIMAQIGSYIPAEIATFRIVDQIFSRMGSSDSIENNCSSFMLEVKEANYILQNATRNSLVVVDELGRETSVEEGVGISFAICEEIIEKKALTFFATHYTQLTQLEDLYPEVCNYHFQVEHAPNEQDEVYAIKYTHKLAIGRSNEGSYGINLARTSSIPRPVVSQAQELIEKWANENRRRETENHHSTGCCKQRDTARMIVHLMQVVRNSDLDDENLRMHLQALQAHYKEAARSDEGDEMEIEDREPGSLEVQDEEEALLAEEEVQVIYDGTIDD